MLYLVIWGENYDNDTDFKKEILHWHFISVSFPTHKTDIAKNQKIKIHCIFLFLWEHREKKGQLRWWQMALLKPQILKGKILFIKKIVTVNLII